MGHEATQIFETYIKVDAEKELGDIDYNTRVHTESLLPNPTKDMFDFLEDIVLNSLVNATIDDFLCDSIYINYIKQVFADCESNAATPHDDERELFMLCGPLKRSVCSCMT